MNYIRDATFIPQDIKDFLINKKISTLESFYSRVYHFRGEYGESLINFAQVLKISISQLENICKNIEIILGEDEIKRLQGKMPERNKGALKP